MLGIEDGVLHSFSFSLLTSLEANGNRARAGQLARFGDSEVRQPYPYHTYLRYLSTQSTTWQ